jgi:hypothetical protein
VSFPSQVVVDFFVQPFHFPQHSLLLKRVGLLCRNQQLAVWQLAWQRQ